MGRMLLPQPDVSASRPRYPGSMRSCQPTSLVALVVTLSLSGEARATDTWSTPFAGAELLNRSTANEEAFLLRVDLCAAGIDVRTSAVGEKGRTVGSFSSLVGAKAAINGDFFGSGFSTDGPSMHAGALWGGSDHGYVAPVSFGAGFVDIPHHGNGGGPAAGAREVVSGHPTLLDDGVVVGNPGDGLCTNRHPRTAVGLSADHTKLILAVIDGRRPGAIGMTCDELAAFMSEHGAFDAVNMDGGGSSTLVVNGGVRNTPSDGSQRTVGNHLAIVDAVGSPLCPNAPPRGFLDAATCAGATGWAQDLDAPDATIDVHVTVDGPAGAGRAFVTSADVQRDDLCSAIGSCAHGFTWPIAPVFFDGNAHTVHAYGIDSEGGSNTLLSGSPLSFTCTAPAPPLAAADGVKRHVTSPDVLTAWGLGFDDVYALGDDVSDVFYESDSWPTAPRLVRADGDPAVYLIDTLAGVDVKRHVTSPDSMAAWRLRFDAVELLTLPELDAIALGAPLPAAPFLFRDTGPEVYLLDVDARDDEDGGGEGEGEGGEGEGDEGEGEGADGEGLPPSVATGCASMGGVGSLASLAVLLARMRRRR